MNKQKSVFIDTCLFIYFIDHNDEYYPTVSKLFSNLLQDGTKILTSVVTIEEYSVIPYRNNDMKHLNEFYKFITDFDIHIVEITKEIAQMAAKLRAKYNRISGTKVLKVASSIVSACDILYTNDRQLSYITETPITMLSNLLGKS